MSSNYNMDRNRQKAMKKVKETKQLRDMGEKRQGARNFRHLLEDYQDDDNFGVECENEFPKS